MNSSPQGTELIRALVDSEALKVAPATEVFWYTSGKVGPYYINTHYLFGGPQEATALLQFIETNADPDSATFAGQLQERIEGMYAQDQRYRGVIDRLAETATSLAESYDYVSGGQRRDWFFSIAVAGLLQRPHLYLYKDLSATLASGENGAQVPAGDLRGSTAVHVADLVTEASSYLRSWIPALRDRGAEMGAAINVVDRAQGGIAAIRGQGVGAAALLRVDGSLFDALLDAGLVDATQHQRLHAYFQDPDAAMKQFLEDNPNFVQDALNGDDPRTAQRARLLVEEDLYGLNPGG
jgi:orotate phosphoribosyltransferase